MRTVTIICSAVIGTGVLATVLLAVLGSVMRKSSKVCFAVYPNYIFISKNLKSKEPLEKVLYEQISEYTFDNDKSETSCDIHELSTGTTSRYRHNTGSLKVIAQDTHYETRIGNINLARELLQKLIPIAETYKKDW